jgi:hypothetical protein
MNAQVSLVVKMTAGAGTMLCFLELCFARVQYAGLWDAEVDWLISEARPAGNVPLRILTSARTSKPLLKVPGVQLKKLI